jgi:hypothetical protein
LEEHLTHYDFLHSRKSCIIWTGFGIIVSMAILYFQPPKTVCLTLLVAIAGSYGYAYWFMTIIRWLFPKFEIENTTQIRFRKWILVGLVGGTIVAVIGGLILELLISLLQK